MLVAPFEMSFDISGVLFLLQKYDKIQIVKLGIAKRDKLCYTYKISSIKIGGASWLVLKVAKFMELLK